MSVISRSAAERQSGILACHILVHSLCPLLNMRPDDIMSHRRRDVRTSHCRHCLIYLARTQLNLSLSVLAAAFQRDRKAIRHACTKIESARDDPAFDAWLTTLETFLKQEQS